VKGTWSSEDGTETALDLRPNGEYVRDVAEILNGVFINGARPFQRDTGRFSVSVKHQTITLHPDGGAADEVFAYVYTPAPVLNGMYLPGHEPAAHLTLTRQPPPMSHIAFSPQHFTSVQSWCTADADCTRELGDHTWTPYFLNGSHPVCDVSTNACVNQGYPTGGGDAGAADAGPPPGRCDTDADCPSGQACNNFVAIACFQPPYCGVCQ